MDFDTFLNAGWNDHATDPEGVWRRCQDAVPLVGEPGQLMALGILAAHVSGEHLGRWNEGAAFLDTLRGHASYSAGDPAARQLHVSCAALHLAAGDARAAERELAPAASADEHAASPRIRMLAATAAALAGRGRTETAIALFREALDLAAYDPPASDPAARALAVTGNNLAVELETASERDAAGTELMKAAATTARKYWERVGTWVNVRIAEVRLAHTHLQAHELGGRPRPCPTRAGPLRRPRRAGRGPLLSMDRPIPGAPRTGRAQRRLWPHATGSPMRSGRWTPETCPT